MTQSGRYRDWSFETVLDENDLIVDDLTLLHFIFYIFDFTFKSAAFLLSYFSFLISYF